MFLRPIVVCSMFFVGFVGGLAYFFSINSSYEIWEPLCLDLNWKEKYKEEGLLGKKYGFYLVGVDNKYNISWWDSAFSRFQKTKDKKSISKNFDVNLINEGYTDPGFPNGLNRACEILYKKKLSEITQIEEIWSFCSNLMRIPQTISKNNDQYPEESIGYVNREKLLSVKEESKNEALWYWKNIEFISNSESQLSEYFKSKYISIKWTITTLQKVCEKAYLKKSVDSETKDSPNAANVIKYCSLDGE